MKFALPVFATLIAGSVPVSAADVAPVAAPAATTGGEPAAAPPLHRPTRPETMPLRAGLAGVPVGSWSEYRMVRGDKVSRVKVALVSRSGDQAVIEISDDSIPPDPKLKSVLGYHLTIRPDDPGALQTLVVQMGANDPFVDPRTTAGFKPFERIDEKTFLAAEQTTVPAGRFATARHYRKQIETGQVLDVWTDTRVFPLGIVALTRNGTNDKHLGKALLPARWDLVAFGASGARTQIQRPLAAAPKAFARRK